MSAHLEIDEVIIGASLSIETSHTIENTMPLNLEINLEKCEHLCQVEDLNMDGQVPPKCLCSNGYIINMDMSNILVNRYTYLSLSFSIYVCDLYDGGTTCMFTLINFNVLIF
jgi:hypothetical protein